MSCSCGIDVVQEGIPHGVACPLAGGVYGSASIPDLKVGEECSDSGLDGRLEAVAANVHLEAVAASMQLEAGDSPHDIASVGPI
jgi:hypothetical protein